MSESALSRAANHRENSQDSITILIERRSLTRQCLSAWLEQHARDTKLVAVEAPLTPINDQGARIALIIWCTGTSSFSSSRVILNLERILQRFPKVPLAVLADREDPADIRNALTRGVNGYVPTSLDRQEAWGALCFVRAGGTYVPASTVIDQEREDLADQDKPTYAPRRLARQFDNLTPRELDVVEQLRRGKPNKVIAHELAISESTVKVFVHRILNKLGAVNRTEVAYLAQQRADYLERPDPMT